MNEIKIFFFVLSIIFLLKNVLVFGLKIFQSEPEPMGLTKIDTILIYLSLSYFITFIFI